MRGYGNDSRQTGHCRAALKSRISACRPILQHLNPGLPADSGSVRHCRAALKSRTCLKDDELLQINPGFRKRIMHLNPGLGTRQNEEEGADSGVNETVET